MPSDSLLPLSHRTEYAFIALLEMASQFDRGKPLQIRQIAEKHAIPDRYLEQIFATLRHAKIVQSHRGNRGGYALSRPPWQITLLEVLTCLEPLKPKQFKPSSSNSRTAIREIWQEAHQQMQIVLQRHTLQDLSQQRLLRQQIHAMYHI